MKTQSQKPLHNLQSLEESQFSLIEEIKQEYEQGFLALNSLGEYTVTFYGGSRVKPSDEAYQNIEKLAKRFGERGWGVVSGGGPGIMTASLKGAQEGGGNAIAFNITIKDELDKAENPDTNLTFNQFSVRKYMLRQSDVFIFAPGGFGTLDELMEILTLIKTHKSPKKPIFLFDSSFWKGYTEWFENILLNDRGVIDADMNNLFMLVDSPDQVMNILFG